MRTNWLFILFVAYIVSAGTWWSYLLWVKNEDARQAKQALLYKQLQENGFDDAEIQQMPAYTELNQRYSRQSLMILGEGAALMLLMLVGLWQIQRSRRKEQALGQQQQNFLLSITHELKSPLASIQLTLETFERRAERLPPDTLRTLSQQALKETGRLPRHIETMLLAARMEGGYSYQFETLDYIQLLQQCIDFVQPKYKGAIRLHTDLQQALLYADRLTLASAVSNLLENAVEYAADTERIDLRLFIDKQNYVLEVADYGRGLPESEQARVFDKFYRVGNENQRNSKGTGLGLYIVREFAKAHRGDISVSANAPRGCVFRLSLPALLQQQEEA